MERPGLNHLIFGFGLLLALSFHTIQITSANDVLDLLNDEQNVTASVNSTGTTEAPSNSTAEPTDNDESEGQAVIIACIIIAIIIILAAIIAFILLRKKRMSQMMDTEKKMQIQMTSARNAGVYQDLTVSNNTDDKPAPTPEHERLKAAEDV